MGEYLSRFTFYDIVGYLVPGVIGTAVIAVLLSMFRASWAIPAPSSTGEWVAFSLGAYFVGHALQAAASSVFRRRCVRDRIAARASKALKSAVALAVERYPLPGASDADRFAALDLLKVDFADREIFVARQGFFRGSSLAFLLLGGSLVAATVLDRSVAAFGLTFDRWLSLLGGLLALAAGLLFRLRYRDFVRYELEWSAASVLREHCVTAPNQESPQRNAGPPSV